MSPYFTCTPANARAARMVEKAVADAGFLPPLSFGVPPIGIGTYELRGAACVNAVRSALQMGYRLVDTAAVYRNEELVGEGIATSGVPRADLFIVVKIAMKSMGSDAAVRQGILDSLRKLRIDYADCVLMHWPGCGGLKPQDAAAHRAARARCWQVMHELQAHGKVRYCGVSNFLPRHFKDLNCFNGDDSEDAQDTALVAGAAPHASIRRERKEERMLHGQTSSSSSAPSDTSAPPQPAASSEPYLPPILNQIELHPLCVQRDVDAYCRGCHGMILQQYSPLGKGDARLLQHRRLLEVHAQFFTNQSDGNHSSTSAPKALPESARLYSVVDLILMWGLAQGYCTLVRSHRVDHLRANLDASRDYFASVRALAKGAGGRDDAGADESRVSGGMSRALLTAEQLEVIQHLRAHMDVEGEPDTHLCWYSSEVA
ncbi:hypothetical protein JKF63_04148 [Porcisia hertigi]|uniref:NADP-dependent oxidoreductase domain-containing protein n=1 Tax=Porcisia hertigi TaxID=2761500 RepID=A0A836LHE4_9TRYP|nr:hypothetical protein JKF63_04148 [Porcisia hertigi]